MVNHSRLRSAYLQAARDARAGRTPGLPSGVVMKRLRANIKRTMTHGQISSLREAASEMARAAAQRLNARKPGDTYRVRKRLEKVRDHGRRVAHLAGREMRERALAFPDPSDVARTEAAFRSEVVESRVLSKYAARALRALSEDRHEWGGGINLHRRAGTDSEVPEKITARRGQRGAARADPDHHVLFHTHPRRGERETYWSYPQRLRARLAGAMRTHADLERVNALARELNEINNRARFSGGESGGGDMFAMGLRYKQTHVLAAGRRFLTYNPLRRPIMPDEYTKLVRAAQREAWAACGLERVRTIAAAEAALKRYEHVYFERMSRGARGLGSWLQVTKGRPRLLLTWYVAHNAQDMEKTEQKFALKEEKGALSSPRRASRRAGRAGRPGSRSRSRGTRRPARSGRPARAAGGRRSGGKRSSR